MMPNCETMHFKCNLRLKDYMLKNVSLHPIASAIATNAAIKCLESNTVTMVEEAREGRDNVKL